jgi:preprotein translocase SecE subunit
VAKTRAQRKAEQRRRQAQQQEGRTDAELTQESRAQHDTQVGETPEAPAPSKADVGAPAAEAERVDKIGRRAQRQADKERKAKAKESERRRAPKAAAPVEKRQRGGVIGFFISCWAELKRVQWPDRETLIQASAITLVFITIMAAYLGVLDAVFNWLVQRIL